VPYRFHLCRRALFFFSGFEKFSKVSALVVVRLVCKATIERIFGTFLKKKLPIFEGSSLPPAPIEDTVGTDKDSEEKKKSMP
jgi:hypothetical protein